MFNVFSYFYSSSDDTEQTIKAVEEPLNPLLEKPIKYSHVDAHLLIWDIHHLSYHDLEDKYRAKHLTLCNLLKHHGYPIFQTPSASTNCETMSIKIPQELHLPIK
jgi:hypothetical protein